MGPPLIVGFSPRCRRIGFLVACLGLGALAMLSAPPPSLAAPADQDELQEAKRVLSGARIPLDGPSLLAYLKKRTIPETDRAKLAELVRQLGDDDFQVRKKAFQDLQAVGQIASGVLEAALKTTDDAEIQSSVKSLLDKIKAGTDNAILIATARLLAATKPDGSANVLLAYFPLAATDDTVQEAFLDALVAVGLKGGKPDDLVVAATRDKDPLRRAAAAFVLGKAGADQRPVIRRLLKDSDDRVRFLAAVSLVQAGDKSAVETLIALLSTSRDDLIWQTEDLLLRVAATAGDKSSPPVVDTSSASKRQEGREAWAKWWKTNSTQVKLARLNSARGYRGVTLLCEYTGSGMNGQGRIWLCGRDGKQKWEINNGLGGPLDARLLPNGHVLVAEYGANRVTERDQKGIIKWEIGQLGNVCSCQRLANGNTLIATMSQLTEVNHKKERVFTINGAAYYATKLRNNHIVYTTNNQIVELDAAHKEIKRINVNGVSWGSVEKLPNGRYLVAQYGAGKAAEIDDKGKELWSVNVAAPTLATRLRNGHTMVASPQSNTVYEFDQQGKQVWSQRAQGQPWRGRRY